MINAMRYTEDLEKAGMEHELARILVRGQVDMLNENMVTKIDFKELDFGLKDEVRNSTVALRKETAELGEKLRAEMKELGIELRKEMKELGIELRTEMESLKNDLSEVRSELKEFQDKLIIKISASFTGIIVVLGTIKEYFF